jgi:hypothetical protein
MKFQLKLSSLLLIIFCSTGSSQVQLAFQNLGFESATLVPIPNDFYKRVLFAPAFPSWTAFAGGDQETSALYNNVFLDSAGISIVDSNSPVGGPIQGHFTAVLQAGVSLTTGQEVQTRLAQTGLIPPGTESVLFKADPRGFFHVMIGGQVLSLTSLGNGANYKLFGADIHQFAGQSAELRFTAGSDDPLANHSYLFLDGIQFSTQTVPEPGVVSLILCGLLFFGVRFRKVVGSWLASGKR